MLLTKPKTANQLTANYRQFSILKEDLTKHIDFDYFSASFCPETDTILNEI